MRTLVKYELKEGENKVSTPNMSEIVCATDYDGKVWVWMEVETKEEEFVDRVFLVARTETVLNEKAVLQYVGYAHLSTGNMVIVFEIL